MHLFSDKKRGVSLDSQVLQIAASQSAENPPRILTHYLMPLENLLTKHIHWKGEKIGNRISGQSPSLRWSVQMALLHLSQIV
jgi:hypothetical protein